MVVTRSTLDTDAGYHATKYYKITNLREKHKGYQYKTGLNVLDMPFQLEGDCVSGGLYFATIDALHMFASFGVWVREVRLPLDARYVKVGNKYRADKIYLGGRVHIGSVLAKAKYPLVYEAWNVDRCDVCNLYKDDLGNALNKHYKISGINCRGEKMRSITGVMENTFNYLTHARTCQIYDKNKMSNININFRQATDSKTKEFDDIMAKSTDDVADFDKFKISVKKCKTILKRFHF